MYIYIYISKYIYIYARYMYIWGIYIYMCGEYILANCFAVHAYGTAYVPTYGDAVKAWLVRQ